LLFQLVLLKLSAVQKTVRLLWMAYLIFLFQVVCEHTEAHFSADALKALG
jgi:hypothetical protein